MITKETAFAIAAIALVVIVGLLGFAPNIAAYDETDTTIISIELTFDDNSTVILSNDQVYELTANQTAVVSISVHAQYYRHNATETILRRCGFELADPSGDIYTGGISDDDDARTEEYNGSTTLETGYYNITDRYYLVTETGSHVWSFYQYFIENGTFTYFDGPADLFHFTLVSSHATEDPNLFIGDWEWFEMGMGFIGVIGFIATPVFTAKLMSSKDPIVLMSAFLICMIMFGTFVYVFLLGGS